MMNGFGRMVLWAWIPLALLIFAFLKPRRAVLVAYIGAWLFLPMGDVKLRGIPDLGKITAASFGVFLGVLLFDLPTLLKFRPKWYDLPMLLWCLCPYITSEKTGLGWYDGASNLLAQSSIWGIPYLIGRVYFNDWESIRELGMAVFIGGLIYVPPVLFEMRVSPQLHKWVYGFRASTFGQEIRWGGYRPSVFMQSGLAVSMWMTTATLVGFWLWMTKSVRRFAGLPMGGVVFFLGVIAILCKSSGAMSFLFAGICTLLWIKYIRNPLPLLVLIAVPPVYMYQRATLNWDGTWLKEQATRVFGEERGQSLGTRIDAENKLTQHELEEAPDKWWGFGKWSPDTPGRAPWRLYRQREWRDDNGVQHEQWQDICPTDGLWVITLGQYGIIGLIALTVTILLPAFILMRRVPMKLWDHPLMGTAAPLCILLVLHMSDNLLNAMVNPIFVLALGGISAIGPSLRKLYQQYRMQQAYGMAQGGTPGFPVVAGAQAAYAPGPYAAAGYGAAGVYGAPPTYQAPFGQRGRAAPRPR